MDYLLSETCTDEMGGRAARLELLLREAYHRIANSLQLVSTMVGREARGSHDAIAKARLETTKHNIEAIAGVHALLSLGRSSEMVPLNEYMTRLVGGLQNTLASDERHRRIALRCSRVVVQPEFAMGIGMIVNELVGNAWKYAYPHDEPGEVRVCFMATDGGFVLEVEDDGPGFNLPLESKGSGLGTPMIRAMARHIGAEFRYADRGRGTCAIVQASAATALSCEDRRSS